MKIRIYPESFVTQNSNIFVEYCCCFYIYLFLFYLQFSYSKLFKNIQNHSKLGKVESLLSVYYEISQLFS